MKRFEQQMNFILEVDKVKNIFRQTYLADGQRKENDAEHSWHLALSAVLLKEHMKEDVDLTKVMIMVLIHDLVEIDAGDTYLCDEEGAKTKADRENKAADRLFHMLPEDQGEEFDSIWREFEERKTPEARFAAALDRLQPVMLNDATNGKAWEEHGITEEQVRSHNEHVKKGSLAIWEYLEKIFDKNIEKGKIQRSSL